ncbi:MAG: cytochrome c oxidase subunit 3 [Cyclobacteriaceae bacterium]|nr:cytochrome c oxidase subunit 3 [Cyclobacteriaceae bacterium]MCH8517175.1 cytochrome c oxidase subunit 3 [Cyclobacteriaceae bacterium]
MAGDSKKADELSFFERLEKMHPFKMLLYLSIFGSCLIFGFLIIAFTLSTQAFDPLEDASLPIGFVVSTFIILLSSYTIGSLTKRYANDDLAGVKRSLMYTLFLGIIFFILQILGWRELQEQNIFFSGTPSQSYLYVISGAHLIHLIGGLFFILYLWIRSARSATDPVKSLLFLSNSYYSVKIKMAVVYWHFLDISWVVLFITFIFLLP